MYLYGYRGMSNVYPRRYKVSAQLSEGLDHSVGRPRPVPVPVLYPNLSRDQHRQPPVSGHVTAKAKIDTPG